MKLILLLMFAGIMSLQAQEKKTQENPETRPITAISKASVAVLKNIKDEKTHRDFIRRFRRSDLPGLISQYKAWHKTYPKEVLILIFLSELEPEKSIEYLTTALNITPKNVDILARLAEIHWQMRDFIGSNEYKGKIFDLAPTNPKYAYNYARSFHNLDSLKHWLKLSWVAEEFPSSPERIRALFDLYYLTGSNNEKSALFNEAYANANKNKEVQEQLYYFSNRRFYDLLNQDLDSAALFSQKILSDSIQPRWKWIDKYRVAKELSRVKWLLKQDSASAGLRLLDTINLKDTWKFEHVWAEENIWSMTLQAKLQLGLDLEALNSVINRYSYCPTTLLRNQMNAIGSKLGLDSLNLMERVWHRRDSLSHSLDNFSYKNILTGDSLRYLSSLSGKPTLISFWFPGCGPCVTEFEYFESTVSKFGNKINYIAPNTRYERTYLVAPLVRKMRYSFTPVELTDNILTAEEMRKGNPYNLLLDEKGNVVFSDFSVGESNPESLKLMLDELLSRQEIKALTEKEKANTDTLQSGS